MHILIIPSWYPSSYNSLLGIFFKEQAEALSKYGYKVGVIAIQGVGIRQIVEQKKINLSAEYYVENNVHTYRKQYLDIKSKVFLKKIKMYFFIKFFKKYIKKHGLPDIIHLHSFLHGEYALWIKHNYNISFVVTEHLSSLASDNLKIDLFNLAEKIYLESAYNIAVSDKLKSFLCNKFNKEFIYIPNIVNIDYFTIKKSIKNNTFTFINIAHLTKNKNQNMLIKAFYDVFKKNNNVILTIVGQGSEYNNLYKTIRDLNMKNRIFLYGSASRDEVKELLHNSNAFVLSSKYETFGVVLIEALSCGLPIISTKCGGPESIIKSDKVGVLCEINQSSLSSKLIEVYENRFNYNKELIRKYAVNKFSEKTVLLELSKIYKKVVKL